MNGENKKDWAVSRPAPLEPRESKEPKKKKKWWIVIVVLLGIGAIGSMGDSSEEADAQVKETVVKESVAESVAEVVEEPVEEVSSEVEEIVEEPIEAEQEEVVVNEEPEMTMGQKNALRKAESYLDFMAFSYSGLIDQLEFDGFSTEDATFAVDNCGADWNEQAAKKAESYLDFMAFSRDGLIEQLEFDGFTREQAEYGATAVGY